MELVEEASGVGESGGEPGSCQAFTIIVIQNFTRLNLLFLFDRKYASVFRCKDNVQTLKNI